MLNRPAILAVLLVLLALVRIVATYSTFSHSCDEAHFAAGLEYLAEGKYTLEYQHPPLARIAVAIGPYLSGLRPHHKPVIWDEANQLLGPASQPAYWRTLALARIGVLPFFLLACWILFLWSRDLYGQWAAIAAVGLFTMLPPVLAHSGVATLDIAAMATVFTASYAWFKLLNSGSPAIDDSIPAGATNREWGLLHSGPLARGVWLGVAVAAAVLSKFSALMFLPVLFLVIGVTARKLTIRATLQACAIALIVCGILIRLVYGQNVAAFYQGIGDVLRHNANGHQSWLLGEYRFDGWWYFFPVVLAVKTPIGFLVLAMTGGLISLCALVRRTESTRDCIAALCALAVLLVCLPARINLGVRHILIIYPFLAMLAGHAVIWMLRHRSFAVYCVGTVLLWCVVFSSLGAHPDYLSYFNEAVTDSAYVLAESDLDWGQDLQRLAVKLKELKVDRLHLNYFGSADLGQFDLPPHEPLEGWMPVKGWVAVSIHVQTIEAAALGKTYHAVSPLAWLDRYQPVAMAGKSIRIYHIE